MEYYKNTKFTSKTNIERFDMSDKRIVLFAQLSDEQAEMKQYLIDKGYHLPNLMRNMLVKLYNEEKNKEVAT